MWSVMVVSHVLGVRGVVVLTQLSVMDTWVLYWRACTAGSGLMVPSLPVSVSYESG